MTIEAGIVANDSSEKQASPNSSTRRYVLIGLIFLAVVGLVVGLSVGLTRRNKNNDNVNKGKSPELVGDTTPAPSIPVSSSSSEPPTLPPTAASPPPTLSTSPPTAATPPPTVATPPPTLSTPPPTVSTPPPTASTPSPTVSTPLPTASTPPPTVATPPPTASTSPPTMSTPEPSAKPLTVSPTKSPVSENGCENDILLCLGDNAFVTRDPLNNCEFPECMSTGMDAPIPRCLPDGWLDLSASDCLDYPEEFCFEDSMCTDPAKPFCGYCAALGCETEGEEKNCNGSCISRYCCTEDTNDPAGSTWCY